MAIYHLRATTGSIKTGQSAAAKSDYILREGKYASDRSEVAFSMSANIPEFAADNPRLFWEAADNYERSNGRLFREIEVSLPRELDLQQQISSMQRFAQALGLGDLPYTMAIHRGNDTNPHCHLMFNERVNDGIERDETQHFKRFNAKKPEQGGAQKTTEFCSKEWVGQTRALWAEVANECLAEAGHDARIDHRSLIDQGIDRVPQIHLGPAAYAMEKRGIETDRGDQLAEVMDHNDELNALRHYENELRQEQAHERSREHPEIQGPEGSRRSDPALDRGRGERSEPDQRPADTVSQVNSDPDQRPGQPADQIHQRNEPEPGAVPETAGRAAERAAPAEPAGDETGSKSRFSAWLERKLNHRVSLEFSRLRSLLSGTNRDPRADLKPAADPRPDPAPKKPHVDLQPDPKPAQIQYADLGVQKIEAGRPMDPIDQFYEQQRKRQEKAAQAKREAQRLDDPGKAADIDFTDADALDQVEEKLSNDDEIRAKRDSDQPMQPGEEGYDAFREEEKERKRDAPKDGPPGEEHFDKNMQEMRRIMRDLNRRAEAQGAEQKPGHDENTDAPEPPKPKDQGPS